MQYQTDDLRITGMQEAIAPESLMQQIPLDAEISTLVFRTRQEIAKAAPVTPIAVRSSSTALRSAASPAR